MNTLKVKNEYIELIKRLPLAPIRSRKQFDTAIKLMKELCYRNLSLSHSEKDYLYVLSNLIIEYEKEHLDPPGKVTPVEALKYLMEVNNLKQSDLAPIVGHKSNLSAFLHGKRGLSKINAVRLGEYFKVSPALFLEYH
jgi:HTH-type transcriptional regulator / antitoxin HigA